MTRIHYWLPEKTSYGEKINCMNCRYECEGKRDGWLCGNWKEAEQIQVNMFQAMKGASDDD